MPKKNLRKDFEVEKRTKLVRRCLRREEKRFENNIVAAMPIGSAQCISPGRTSKFIFLYQFSVYLPFCFCSIFGGPLFKERRNDVVLAKS